jgi:hypothetical protein
MLERPSDGAWPEGGGGAMSQTRRVDLTMVRGRKSVWVRKPRGKKRALSTGARAVPPSSWDDLGIGGEAVRQARRRRP